MKQRTLAFVAAATVLLACRASYAQWAVVDAGNIVQTTATAVSTLQTMYNTYKQIELMTKQAEQQLQHIQSIDPTSFSNVKRLFDESKLTYDTIRSDATSIGFTVQEVNRDFDTLFPKDKAKWKNVRYSDYDGYYTRWNTEVTASSKAAERAQSSIAIVEKNNKAIADILARSQDSAGEIRQLQLINQQLALLNQTMGALLQNVTTIGRVTSNMAASSAGEKMLTREAKARRSDGYTNLGKTPRRLTRLP